MPGRRIGFLGLCALTGFFLSSSAVLAKSKVAKEPKEVAPTAPVGAPEPLPTLAAKTFGFEKRVGFLELFLDPRTGKIFLALPSPGPDGGILELIYSDALATGLGSNPVGLDRGQLGEARWLKLRKVGTKILFEQPNLSFRAQTDNLAEQRAAVESFASSILWAAEIVALDPDGKVLIDLTPFLVRDVHQIAVQLKETGQGDYSLDLERSVADPSSVLAFPDNVELEAILTFSSDAPGPLARATAPNGRALSFVQHHSLIRLPPDGYRMRTFDPRIGMFGPSFQDYASPLNQSIVKRFVSRHRLEKVDPGAARSRVKKPIVFYVDPGAPEPVRSALVEGASWWAAAFEEAGFIDAFRVEVLPIDKHPLDVRNNMIQWVHRATRGWSYGTGIIDPRTGEILKGHVSLGSLRIRHDRLIFEGLLGTAQTGTGAPDDPIELALARIRQLSAHEVGHALGITHNFAASTYGRESVMDYPAPLISVDQAGQLDTSAAYGVGVGKWDRLTIAYGYSEFAPGADEGSELEAIVRRGLTDSLLFLTDEDARSTGAADPRASLWDNGDDPVIALEQAVSVRRIGLQAFGLANLPPSRPLSELQEVFVPLYLYHRYQLEAAAKVVAGVEYSYNVAGDGQELPRMIGAARQRRALRALTALIEPRFLDVREDTLQLLTPRPFGWQNHVELFAGATAPTFDPLSAAQVAASLVFDQLIQPQRLQRALDQSRRDPTLPNGREILQALVDQAFSPLANETRLATIQWSVRRSLVERLIRAADQLDWALRVEIHAVLLSLRDRCLAESDPGSAYLANEILRFLERPHVPSALPAPPEPPPPGSPIGQDEPFCTHPPSAGSHHG